MKLAGSHTFPFPRTVVWAALMDPAVLARTLPGCERLERVGAADRFAGALQVAIGPVKGQFQGTLDLTDLHPPERYKMLLEGQGASGFVKGEGAIWLEEVAAGTDLHYDLDAEVGGRLAGVGQRLLESSAKSVARQGLAGLEQQLRARQGAVVAAESVARETAAAKNATAELAGVGGRGTGEPTAASVAVADAPGVAPGDRGSAVTGVSGAASPDSTGAPATPAGAISSPGTATPSAAAFAGRVARDVAADLVPPAARRWLLVGAVVMLVVATLLIARSCG
jgi:uncharacterized protein